MLDDDRRFNVREISENVDASLNTVHRVIADELNMSKVSSRWVPRLLTDDDKLWRLLASQEFVKIPKRGRKLPEQNHHYI